MFGPATWRVDEVAWGSAMCAGRCMRLAVLLLDGEPYCLSCAERLIERWALLALDPELARTLPPPLNPDAPEIA